MEAAAAAAGLAGDSLEVFVLAFEQAVRDFEQRGSARPPPAREAWEAALGGTDGSGSQSISPGGSLDSSEEDLRAGGASSQTPSSTAKLGDTRELEAFIADLDQILKEM